MTPNDLFNQFTEQFNKVFGPGFESLNAEMKQHIKAAAQSTFDKLDLVTREEFDAQQAVLARSREKLDTLEKQVAALTEKMVQDSRSQVQGQTTSPAPSASGEEPANEP